MTESTSLAASLALQKALHQTLIDFDRLVALLGGARIFDGAPPDAAFPYVTIGEGRVLIDGVDNISRHDHESRVFVFSQHDGISETKQILEAIHDALAQTSLSAAGHQIILLTITEMRSQRMNDGKTWRGELIFRALTEPDQD